MGTDAELVASNQSGYRETTNAKKLLASESENDFGTFMAKLGQDHLIRFQSQMQMIFGKDVKVSAKDGVTRISEKIVEIAKERGIPLNQAWGYISDLLRLTVFCTTPRQVIEAVQK